MRLIFTFYCLFIFSLTAGNRIAFGRETIRINGQSFSNCKLVEISQEGPVYLSGDSGEHLTVPWKEITPVQENKIRTQHNDALINAICDARYVNGTVFHANKDGVVVQITLKSENDPNSKEGIAGYYQGAKIVKSGLVLISDLPLHVPRSTGDPITMIVYFREKGEFDMGIAQQKIDHLTTAKPDWFQVREWKNSSGQAMQAQLLGVKDDKVLFAKEDGSRFVYSFSQLDADSQKQVKETQKRLEKFPVP